VVARWDRRGADGSVAGGGGEWRWGGVHFGVGISHLHQRSREVSADEGGCNNLGDTRRVVGLGIVRRSQQGTVGGGIVRINDEIKEGVWRLPPHNIYPLVLKIGFADHGRGWGQPGVRRDLTQENSHLLHKNINIDELVLTFENGVAVSVVRRVLFRGLKEHATR
jgi:hypothetical protein